MRYEGILGLDSLHLLNAVITIPERTLQMTAGTADLEPEFPTAWDVPAAGNLTILPREERLITLPFPLKINGNLLVETHPNLLLKSPLRVARALVDANRDTLVLRVLNVDSRPQTITTGQKIALLSPVQALTEAPSPAESRLPQMELDQLTAQKQWELKSVLTKHRELFARHEYDLEQTTVGYHRIQLSDPTPI